MSTPTRYDAITTPAVTRTARRCVRWLALAALMQAPFAAAQLTSANFALTPPLITQSAPPNVLLVLSDDHELYKKAYSDFTDIDGDGLVDGAYNDSFTYSGYFDSNFCYSYDSTDSRFEPAENISTLIPSNGHACNAADVDGDWSGNFLNWVSMTRMDIVRHVLYGGYRQTDTSTTASTSGVTVLERVYLPEDVHSFVKVFTGTTQRYTPWTQTSISLCNTTFSADTNPPVIRVANGAWPQWASAEVVQCHYRSEASSANSPDKPQTTDRPSTFSYNVRVQVCVDAMDVTADRCKPYSNTSTGLITYKPIGLLQRYGDNSSISFGLMSGSANKKIAGGVLRKNIAPLTGNSTASLNEIDLNNGTFLNQTATSAGIINTINRFKITSWNYTSNRYDDCSTFFISKSTFMTSTDAGRQCRNWGNPLSEIYLEALRYYTGINAVSGTAVPTTAFNTSDSTILPSLPQLTWSDPLSGANSCSSCSIIVLSTGLNSFDKDQLTSVTDLWEVPGSSRMTVSKLDTLLDSIGTLEGLTTGTYLVGRNGTDNNELCTAKAISYFSDAMGICPEIGGLEGGYDIAALSYHAYTEDLRNDFEGLQQVATYSVSLAQNLPTYTLNVNNRRVTFVPICKGSATAATKIDGTDWTDCSFIDAKIESQDAFGGRMYVAWEDSQWGNDFDMDGISRIEWCIGTNTALCPAAPPNADYGSGYSYADFNWKNTGLTANSIQFRVSVPHAASGAAMKFGVSLSGVTNVTSPTYVSRITNAPAAVMSGAGAAGTFGNPTACNTTGTNPNTCVTPLTGAAKYISRGAQGNGEQYFLLKQGSYTITRLNANSGNRMLFHEPLVYTASNVVTGGAVLPNPLYFTAKYGSFNDSDGDGTPRHNDSLTDNQEWDTRNLDGEETPDGIPDNFFPITNPSQLETSLRQVFEIISSRISSGTAAAVVANSSTGLGSVYQAYYHPQFIDDSNRSIVWGGVLHSMFIDDSGRFREDNGVVGKLESTDTDYVIDIFYDTTASPNRTRFRRYTQTGSGVGATFTDVDGGTAFDLEEIGSIWNARDVLADISQDNLLLQRSLDADGEFNQDAGTRRYIFTYLDSPSSGTLGSVDAGEIVDFTDANFDPLAGNNNFRYLGLPNANDAQKLVKFIRGQDQAGWRSRLVDLPGDGSATPKYWLLGDIVHSSPLVLNPPSERYDIAYGDLTYDEFKQQYERRRQMVYAGGNDGMIHAFNGGVWDAPNRVFQTRRYNTGTGEYSLGQTHELGAEMWAYAPMNLLPHLQWLKEVDYPHVYYMDAPPQSFDVNIFPDDDVHPNGWGTIMVVGMRLGGGAFPVDLDGDDVKETTMSSAYVIMDITDPERPPTLIAELNGTDLGLTTGMPTLVKSRVPDTSGNFNSPRDNQWLLVFGSGPDTLTTAISGAHDAKLFAYDLVEREMVTIDSDAQTPSSDPSGYFGSLRSADWNNDYVDDVIYVGTVEGTESSPTGRMKRIVLDSEAPHMGLSDGSASMSQMLNVAQPVSATPSVLYSVDKDEKWVLFGTGRLFTSLDNRSKTQQSYYGVKEENDYDTSDLALSDLIDSTDVLVETDGAVWDEMDNNQLTIDSEDIDTFTELYNFMDDERGWVRRLSYNAAVDPSERVFNAGLVLGSTVVFTTYKPSVDSCTVEGNGYLYALNYRTGTAESFGPFGQDASGFAYTSIDLGQGAPSAPTAVVRTGDDAHVDSSNVGDISVVTGSTTGVTMSTGFTSAPVISDRLSWEELEIPFD